MGGDYSRNTFDPTKGHSGVHKQQGRVSLDADFNEFEEILDRRSRAEMYDTVGQAVVPSTTPDGFEIKVAGPSLTIGKGRAYVDGILAECFGDMSDPKKVLVDDKIGGTHGLGPLNYDKQPFFYSPAYPALSPATTNLVYLEAWQREVTVLEDPGLREPALNGPDTATRVQTAWQVKALDVGAGPVTCGSHLTAWDKLTAASTGRLTAAAAAVPPDAGPCVINPTGGYTGLENRLYRVEIHQAGALGGAGKATFKWSRDNASLGAPVLSIKKISATRSTITVTSTGRRPMRFDHGDHIELLDDSVEFAMRETGKGGEMAQVLTVNHTTGEIEVDKDLSAVLAGGRNPRIRRWDNAPGEPLVRDVSNGAAIALEDGITVTFGDAATSTLHAGDYWVFAARTADGSIDPLHDAPPRGVLHHFARLALLAPGAAAATDCRVFWPPHVNADGCCTEVVGVGDSIQDAIDRLADKGGCVCLKMGTHEIRAPLTINRGEITIHGEVPSVTIRRVDGGPGVLSILPAGGGANVSVLGITFEAPDGGGNVAMVHIVGVSGGRVADCGLTRVAPSGHKGVNTGITLENCSDYAIETTTFENLDNGVLGNACTNIRVANNILHGSVTGTGKTVASAGDVGIRFAEVGPIVNGIVVERNEIADFRRGIQLGDPKAVEGATPGTNPERLHPGCRVVGNLITRRRTPPLNDALAFAIAVHLLPCEIVENSMNLDSLTDGGILVFGESTLVQRNEVRSSDSFVGVRPDRLPFGVFLQSRPLDTEANVKTCTVRNNLFTGLQQPVVAMGLGRGMKQLRIEVFENRIFGSPVLLKDVRREAAQPGAPIFQFSKNYAAIFLAGTIDASVASNTISRAVCGVFAVGGAGLTIDANSVTDDVIGISLARVEHSRVERNAIDVDKANIPPGRPGAGALHGISLMSTTDVVVSGNSVGGAQVGITAQEGDGNSVLENQVHGGSTGIELLTESDATVSGNRIEDTARDGIDLVKPLERLTVAHNRVIRCGYHDPDDAAGAVATGISVVGNSGPVTIESCQVFDVGQMSRAANPDQPPFRGQRTGISVVGMGAARVSNCVVSGAPLPEGVAPHPNSRALRMLVKARSAAKGFADASSNVLEQAAHMLVEVRCTGEIMFATNRCANLTTAGDLRDPAILLEATVVIVTGNRVRSSANLNSLVVDSTVVNAVGNITTRDAVLNPAEFPNPYTTFNAVGI